MDIASRLTDWAGRCDELGVLADGLRLAEVSGMPSERVARLAAALGLR